MPIGAECADGAVHFRVWAPLHRDVTVVVDDQSWPLNNEGTGYFSASIADVGAGARYRFRIDDRPELYPDPASRYQPAGPHGPSEVVCHDSYRWRHPRLGAAREHQVIYEMHIGTYTREGNFLAASRKLARLAELGVSVIELMPVNEFAGRFNWGYDGVDLFAPCHVYGRPDDLREFIDAAHDHRLAVILDVVYNHLGPDGNYLGKFSPNYFSAGRATEWGDSMNFDGAHAAGVREFFTANAAYWIREFRLDGLRIDATQTLYDRSRVHILADVTRAARAAADEPLLIVAENEPQDSRLLRTTQSEGAGICALWNDDFHHAARVALTRHNEAYMIGYRGHAQEFVSLVLRGFLYQGQYFKWQHKLRGTRAPIIPGCGLVVYLENHDQVANGGFGKRLVTLCSPAELRAMTALLLLGPATPMLFQGQESGSSVPFLFFADHNAELAATTRAGRLEFVSQFASLSTPAVQNEIPPSEATGTFERCKLGDEDLAPNQHFEFHRDLIRMRRTDPAFASQRSEFIEGSVLNSRAFVLRFSAPGADERLLVINLGIDLHLSHHADPLLAPPLHAVWQEIWSSEAVCYGGNGAPPAATAQGLNFHGRSAVVLGARSP
ncbi:MAG: Alpha-amylase-family protein [Betaproteobacteria bacterium]|nr:Alpha-amylase-family protein [Betaproteobacteria bacterium]